MPYDIEKLISVLPPYPPEVEIEYRKLKTNFQRLLFILRGDRTGSTFQEVTGIPSQTLGRWEKEEDPEQRGTPHLSTLAMLASYAHIQRRRFDWEIELMQDFKQERNEKSAILRSVLEGGEKPEIGKRHKEYLASIGELLDTAYTYEGEGTPISKALYELNQSYKSAINWLEDESARTTLYCVMDSFVRDTEVHLLVRYAQTADSAFEYGSRLPIPDKLQLSSRILATAELQTRAEMQGEPIKDLQPLPF